MRISHFPCLRAIGGLRKTQWSHLPTCRRTITTATSLTRRPVLSSISPPNISSYYDLLNSNPASSITSNILSSSILNTLHPSQRFMQIRGAKRRTFNPSHRVRKRRHGFLSRLRTRTGRKTLSRRMEKGRTTLSH